MRVAVVVGVAVPHDAISSAAVEQVRALRAIAEVDEVVMFTQGLGREAPCDVVVTGNPWEMLRHPAFRSSDVAIFHWGIHYALFDAITLLGRPDLPAPVVHFHNCTPVSLVEEGQREQVGRSIEQFHHVLAMRVPLWTYSEFNRRTLIDWGAADGQIDWVTFPLLMPPRSPSKRGADVVSLLSVGRLVPAKGAHVLLDALALLADPVLERIRVRLIGAMTFSSQAYLDQLYDQLRRSRRAVASAFDLVIAPSDAQLAAMYSDADIVVSASYHEGLCVPVIEGYAAGCRAIGTTAGNLPYIVVPPDPVLPPGDPSALAAAIEEMLDHLSVDDDDYHERCRQLVESFSVRSASTMLQGAIDRVVKRSEG